MADSLNFVADPAHPAALFKTPTATYSLRQKNTSNALMLLSPSKPEGESINVFASVHETFELVPETNVATASTAQAKSIGSRGKWHEKFGRDR